VRSSGYAALETTPEAARRWGEHMREAFSHSLLQEADSWYMGANVPGKKRELLYYPNTQAFLRACREEAANGYPGFEFGG
jgi:cyclohexanone monooxygenase